MFIVDTGSKVTSVYYSVVDPKLSEATCIARMLETKVVTGILNS